MSFSRRNFLKCGLLTAASVSLTACQRNVEHDLVSQFQMPEYKLPGQHLYWATTCGECSGGCGLAVKTTDGRAIKVEGIPEHPISRGKVCARGQSGLQAAYHPNRINAFVDKDGKVKERDWSKFFAANVNKDKLKDAKALFVTRTLQGNVGGLMIELAKEVGAKIWVLDFPGRLGERQVIKALTGKAELPRYKIEESDYAVTFGGDMLALGHNNVLSGWGYGQFRQGRGRERGILISVSSRINMTAANSDRWLPVRPGTEGWVAIAVGNLLVEKGKKGDWPAWAKAISLEKVSQVTGLEASLIERLATKLSQAKKPLVIADSDAGNYSNGVESLYAIHALQKLLTGSIETFEPENVIGVEGGVPKGLLVNTDEAIKHLESNSCGAIWTFDVDVVRVLPEKLRASFDKASSKVAFASLPDETTKKCDFTVPIYTWLEDWADQRITGGGLDVYNVQQPSITSLFENARSLGDILMAVKTGDAIAVGIVPDNAAPDAAKGKTIRSRIQGTLDQPTWESLLARGGSWKADTLSWEHYPARVVTPPAPVADPGKMPTAINPYDSMEAASVSAWTDKVVEGQVLVPFATLALKDGSLGNRPWLQELPDPVTTIVWGGWIEMNSEFAKKNEINRHDVVKVTLEGGASIQGPAFPLPSLHPDTIAIPVGDENPDYSMWAADPQRMNFGLGNQVFGRYGYTNVNYGKGGINPLKSVTPTMTGAGEPHWVGTKVVSVTKVGKTEMVTAMDMRVFNLEREVIPFD